MLTVVRHADRWRPAVRALNQRVKLKEGFGFFEDPTPAWLPPREGAAVFQEYFVAVESDGTARGGYVLKHERVLLRGTPESAACVRGPYSEGAVDGRQGHVVFAMIRDMVARQPHLYGWGLERRAATIVKLFRSFGWKSHATPFFIWVGLPFAGRAPSSGVGEFERCDNLAGFLAAADTVWERDAARYAFVSCRDGKTLADSFQSNPSVGSRLIMRNHGRVLGWASVAVGRVRQHRVLRSVPVGVIWDYFGAPEHAMAIVTAAHRYLIRAGAGVVLASACHADWIDAFRQRRFRTMSRSRHFLVSPALAAQLAPFERQASACFLTFADGEGEHGTLGRAMFG